MKNPVLSSGTVWFQPPNRFRREVKGSSPSVTVSDGRELWIYYPNFKSTAGLDGRAHVDRRPFEACPIPLFNAKNPLHLKIAQKAKECRDVLLPIVRKMKSPVATARADARKLVRGKLNQLDTLVSKLFGETQVSTPLVKKNRRARRAALLNNN